MIDVNQRRTWLFEPATGKQARARILCFPPAGSGPAMFRSWPSALPDGVEILGVRLPGRESRWGESQYAEWSPLTTDLIVELTPVLDLPYVIYGHSFGGMLAYEVARGLQLQGLPLPQALVLSACRTPNLGPHIPVPWDAPSDELWTWVAGMDGTPAIVLEDAGIRTALEPAIRADFRLAHIWRNDRSVLLDVPIETFGSSGDAIVPLHQILGRGGYTSRAYSHLAFPGGHFFVQEYEALVLERLSDICRASFSAEGMAC